MLQPPEELLTPGTTVDTIPHNGTNAATGGIWRVTAPSGARTILKIATPPHAAPPPTAAPAVAAAWATSDDPQHWNYWRREVCAYESGFAREVYADHGIRPPHLIDTTTLADGSVAMRLEHVDGRPGALGTIAEYSDFAARLGGAQARWLGEPMPHRWCSRNWLRQFVLSRPVPPAVDWNDERLAAIWPASLRVALANLWTNRVAVLDRIDRLPRTVAHLDVWPANMIWSEGGPVLLDWAFTGAGALGEDLGNLVFDGFADGLIDIAVMPEFVEAVIAGYAKGAGRDVTEIRRAVGAATAAKYCWFGPRVAGRFIDEGAAGSQTYDIGGTPEEVLERWRVLLTQLIRFAEDALSD